jgi:hypothetical protein
MTTGVDIGYQDGYEGYVMNRVVDMDVHLYYPP